MHQFLLSGAWCSTSLSDTTSPQAENRTCLVSLQPCFSFQEMHCLLLLLLPACLSSQAWLGSLITGSSARCACSTTIARWAISLVEGQITLHTIRTVSRRMWTLHQGILNHRATRDGCRTTMRRC